MAGRDLSRYRIMASYVLKSNRLTSSKTRYQTVKWRWRWSVHAVKSVHKSAVLWFSSSMVRYTVTVRFVFAELPDTIDIENGVL